MAGTSPAMTLIKELCESWRSSRLCVKTFILTTVDTEDHGGDLCSAPTVASVVKSLFNAKPRRTPRIAKFLFNVMVWLDSATYIMVPGKALMPEP
jgi:hypothetical protein